MPVQSETLRSDRRRSEILAAARCADLAAMHDAAPSNSSGLRGPLLTLARSASSALASS